MPCVGVRDVRSKGPKARCPYRSCEQRGEGRGAECAAKLAAPTSVQKGTICRVASAREKPRSAGVLPPLRSALQPPGSWACGWCALILILVLPRGQRDTDTRTHSSFALHEPTRPCGALRPPKVWCVRGEGRNFSVLTVSRSAPPLPKAQQCGSTAGGVRPHWTAGTAFAPSWSDPGESCSLTFIQTGAGGVAQKARSGGRNYCPALPAITRWCE
jgi:hypothetical protein